MKRVLLDMVIGACTVFILILLLGELVGYPLGLSLGEWVLALGAGASLTAPGYILGLIHYQRWNGGRK